MCPRSRSTNRRGAGGDMRGFTPSGSRCGLLALRRARQPRSEREHITREPLALRRRGGGPLRRHDGGGPAGSRDQPARIGGRRGGRRGRRGIRPWRRRRLGCRRCSLRRCSLRRCSLHRLGLRRRLRRRRLSLVRRGRRRLLHGPGPPGSRRRHRQAAGLRSWLSGQFERIDRAAAHFRIALALFVGGVVAALFEHRSLPSPRLCPRM